jgi:hypothetical protein
MRIGLNKKDLKELAITLIISAALAFVFVHIFLYAIITLII